MAQRPQHCSKQCPFWGHCSKKAQVAEAGARVVEHSLTGCSCLLALGFWKGRLRKSAKPFAQIRNVSNLTLAVAHWGEVAEGEKKFADLDHLIHLFVPLAILGEWGLKPFVDHANHLRHLGGFCLVAEGSVKLYEEPEFPSEELNDLLETPLEYWIPEPCQSLIGIGSGIRFLTQLRSGSE